MSDRIAVFNRGCIEQIATPRDLYHQPRTRFVANFVGSSNVIDGVLAQQLCGKPSAFSVRQEYIDVGPVDQPAAPDRMQVPGEVLAVQFLGAAQRIEVQVDKKVIAALQPDLAGDATSLVQPGQAVTLHWARHHMVHLDD